MEETVYKSAHESSYYNISSSTMIDKEHMNLMVGYCLKMHVTSRWLEIVFKYIWRYSSFAVNIDDEAKSWSCGHLKYIEPTMVKFCGASDFMTTLGEVTASLFHAWWLMKKHTYTLTTSADTNFRSRNFSNNFPISFHTQQVKLLERSHRSTSSSLLLNLLSEITLWMFIYIQPVLDYPKSRMWTATALTQ